MKSAAHLPGIVILAGMGGVFVWLVTQPYGPGLLPDSAAYASAAESLARGDGLIGADGGPLIRFPPLFPAALAALYPLGIGPLLAGRLLNTIALTFAVAVSARAAGRAAHSVAAAWVTVLLSICCVTFVEWFAYLLSEALFIALLSIFFVVLARALPADDRRLLVGAALLAAALALTRYIGVVAIAVGCVASLVGRDRLEPRLRRAAIFGAIASLPLAVVLARNWAVSGGLTGYVEQASGPGNPMWRVLRMMVALCAEWFVDWGWIEGLRPYAGTSWFVLLAATTVIVVATAYGATMRRWWRVASPASRRYVAVLALWVVGYAAFLALAAWRINAVRLDARFVAPLFLPVLQLIVVPLAGRLEDTLSGLAGRRPRALWRRDSGLVLPAVVAALLVMQAGRLAGFVNEGWRQGAGGYATAQWQELPFVSWVRQHETAARALSNGPELLYLLNGERRSAVPLASDAAAIAALADRAASGEHIEIIWFEGLEWRTYRVDRQRLLELPGLHEVVALPGGVVIANR